MNGKKILLSLVFSNIITLVILILWRIMNSTNLLFDQVFALTIVTFISSLFLSRVKSLNIAVLKWERVCVSLLAASLFYIFGTAVLLNVDRSRSIYIFAWVNECDRSLNCIEDYVSDNYGKRGWDEVLIRLKEQDSRGLMNVSDSQAELTIAGRLVLNSARISAQLFNLEGFKNEQNFKN